MKAPESSSSLRNNYQKLKQPFHKTSTAQNALYFIGLALRNKVYKETKRTTNLSTFKHNPKKYLVSQIFKKNYCC